MSHVTSCRTRTSSAAQGIWNLIADSRRGFFQRFLNAKKENHSFSMVFPCKVVFLMIFEIVQNNLAGMVWIFFLKTGFSETYLKIVRRLISQICSCLICGF